MTTEPDFLTGPRIFKHGPWWVFSCFRAPCGGFSEHTTWERALDVAILHTSTPWHRTEASR